MFLSRASHPILPILEIKVKDNKKMNLNSPNIDPCPGEAQEHPSRAQRLHTSVLSRHKLWQHPAEVGRVHPSMCMWQLSQACPAPSARSLQ